MHGCTRVQCLHGSSCMHRGSAPEAQAVALARENTSAVMVMKKFASPNAQASALLQVQCLAKASEEAEACAAAKAVS